jgi:hypothetical protein
MTWQNDVQLPLAVARSCSPSLRTRNALSLAAHLVPLLTISLITLGYKPQAGYPSRCCMFLAVTRVPAVAANPAPRDSSTFTGSSSKPQLCPSPRPRYKFHRTVRGGAFHRARVGIAAKGQFDIRSRRRIDAWSTCALAMQGRVRPAPFPFHPPHRSSLFATHK